MRRLFGAVAMAELARNLPRRFEQLSDIEWPWLLGQILNRADEGERGDAGILCIEDRRGDCIKTGSHFFRG